MGVQPDGDTEDVAYRTQAVLAELDAEIERLSDQLKALRSRRKALLVMQRQQTSDQARATPDRHKAIRAAFVAGTGRYGSKRTVARTLGLSERHVGRVLREEPDRRRSTRQKAAQAALAAAASTLSIRPDYAAPLPRTTKSVRQPVTSDPQPERQATLFPAADETGHKKSPR